MCNKFEEFGLLYVVGELDPAEAREYEAHVSACEECRRETEAYRAERAELYTIDILEERPNPAVDAEILRLGSSIRRTTPTLFTPMLFLKKYAPIPVFLMLIMVAVGGYFNYHTMIARELREKYENDDTEAIASSALKDTLEAAIVDNEELAMADSDASRGDTFKPFSETRGNLEMEGVITVKGTGER